MVLDAVKALEKKYEGRTHRLDGFKKLMSARNEEKGIYNWFPFFQAFTSSFLEKIFNRHPMKECQHVLEPFAGSGNTLVSCVEFGKNGYGLEVNPLFRFITQVKIGDYSSAHFREAERIAMNALKKSYDVEIPNLSSFRRLFNPGVLKRLVILRNEALMEQNEKATALLLFALASELLNCSTSKRYGKGLHIAEKHFKREVGETVIGKLRRMRIGYNDFRNSVKKLGRAHVAPCGVFEIEKAKNIPIVDVVLTSPPYCNSSDYVEMYKLELWFLEYVTDHSEFKELSRRTIRSHLSFSDSSTRWTHPAIDEICRILETMELWNSRIPIMIRGYFDDVHSALSNLMRRVKNNGKIIFVIGNSSYSGLVVPSDLLVAEAATALELEVESIQVARQLPPSPQQRKIMDEHSKSLMRESIVTMLR